MMRTPPRLALRALLPVALCLALVAGKSAAAETEAELQKFVKTYFTSWSQNDFKTYRSLFHRDALVALISNGRCERWELTNFLNSQEQIQAVQHMEEVAEATEIKATSDAAAFVIVSWRLRRKPDDAGVTGKDWYTLVRDGGEWRILNLTFWQDEPAH